MKSLGVTADCSCTQFCATCTQREICIILLEPFLTGNSEQKRGSKGICACHTCQDSSQELWVCDKSNRTPPLTACTKSYAVSIIHKLELEMWLFWPDDTIIVFHCTMAILSDAPVRYSSHCYDINKNSALIGWQL